MAEKRANKWLTKTEASFANPLGWRLLCVVRQHNTTPRKFSEEAQGNGNLEGQLERLLKDEGASLMADQLVAYAKRGRVSLLWLITGEGLQAEGLFGAPTGEEMQGFPAELQMAVKAAVDLEGVLLQQALHVAGQVLETHRAKRLPLPTTAKGWYVQLIAALETAQHVSGFRPSTKPPPKTSSRK